MKIFPRFLIFLAFALLVLADIAFADGTVQIASGKTSPPVRQDHALRAAASQRQTVEEAKAKDKWE